MIIFTLAMFMLLIIVIMLLLDKPETTNEPKDPTIDWEEYSRKKTK